MVKTKHSCYIPAILVAHHWPRQSMCQWLEDNGLETWAQKHVMDPVDRTEVQFTMPPILSTDKH